MGADLAGSQPRSGPRRVIVTRPEPEGSAWAQALRSNGFVADALPLIEIAALTDAAAVKALAAAQSQLTAYRACLFVSSNAVRHFFKEKEPIAQQMRARVAIKNIANRLHVDPRQRFLAPGPGTAAALQEAGVPLTQIDSPASHAAQFDSESLWREIGARDWAGQRVLIVRGASDGDTSSTGGSGREWIAGQWRAAGAVVDLISVYARALPRWQAGQQELAHSALRDGSVWLLSSGEAVKNLRALLPAGFDLTAARAVVTHPRIADAAQRAGWGVVTTSRPALPDLIAALRSIESSEP